jgi:hypothetical protein
MLIVVIPLLICIAGALVYAFASNPKLAEIGKIMFWTGLLVTLLNLGPQASVRLGQDQPDPWRRASTQ